MLPATKERISETETLRIKEWSRMQEATRRWDDWRRDPEGSTPPDTSLHWELIRCYRVAQDHGMKGVESRIHRLEGLLGSLTF